MRRVRTGMDRRRMERSEQDRAPAMLVGLILLLFAIVITVIIDVFIVVIITKKKYNGSS